MTRWRQALPQLLDSGEICVLVSVAAVRGSTPREAGATMLVTRHASIGSIGGGQLELRSIESARALIDNAQECTALRRFPLGPELGQCCGGVASVLFERVPPVPRAPWLQVLGAASGHAVRVVRVGATPTHAGHQAVLAWLDGRCVGSLGDAETDARAQQLAERLAGTDESAQLHPSHSRTRGGEQLFVQRLGAMQLPVSVFGAGHVGKALIKLAADLPWAVRWVDGRADAFPGQLPGNVTRVCIAHPEQAVDAAPADSGFVVMTHSHALDLALVARILARDDFFYCGLIGSATKRRRFEKRLDTLGLATRARARLVCPIGSAGRGQVAIRSKHPASIAVATAAEILALAEAASHRVVYSEEMVGT